MKLKSIYINNVLSFKDSYVQRADKIDSESIPISDTITIITGQNNTGKTNFLKCINWLYRGLNEPHSAFTYNGEPIFEITGLFKFEEKDLDRMANRDVGNDVLNPLSKFIGNLKHFANLVADYAKTTEDFKTKREKIDSKVDEIDSVLIGISEKITHPEVKEKDPAYCQLTLTQGNENILFLSPLKEHLITKLSELINELSQIDERVRTGVRIEDPPKKLLLRGIISRLKKAQKRLQKISFGFAFRKPLQNDFETMLFRIKFIDENRNKPIPPDISLSDPLGKDIENFLGGVEIRKNAFAAEFALNKVINNKIKDLNFPLLAGFKYNFSTTTDKVKMTLYEQSADRFITISEASLGIRWLLSLWFQIFSENVSMPDLLIIDEPGFNMHPGAQKDLVTIFDTIVKKFNMQIIYTSHSPFMIDPNRILDVRLVDSHHDEVANEKFSVFDIKPYKKNYEPLNTALGLKFIKPYLLLEKGESYYIVEGESDAIILMCLSQLLFFHGIAEYLDLNKIAIYPAGGATRKKFFNAVDNIRSVSDSARIVVLVDGDTSGKEVKQSIESKYNPSECNDHKISALCIADILNMNEVTIEDIIPIEHYINAFKKFYDCINHPWSNLDEQECIDFIKTDGAPVVKSLIKYFVEKRKETINENDLNKVGIARTVMEQLFDNYGEHDRKEIFAQDVKNGQLLIKKIIELHKKVSSK